MGIFSIRAVEPEAIAKVVSYAPDMGRLPLKGPFKRKASAGVTLGVLRAYEQITGERRAVPQYDELFQIERSIRTPHGTVVAGERGLVVEDPEEANRFSIAIPARESFLGEVNLLVTEVTVPQDEIANPYLRNKTMAIGHAVVEFAKGNIDNPGGGQ